PRKRTFSELIRVTRSIPSPAEISPRRAASYSAVSACERTSVGATSWCTGATSTSPAAIASSVSRSTTNRVTRQTLHTDERGTAGRGGPLSHVSPQQVWFVSVIEPAGERLPALSIAWTE